MLHVQQSLLEEYSRVSRECSSGNLSRVLFRKTIFDEPTCAARSRFYAEHPIRERGMGGGRGRSGVKIRIRRQRKPDRKRMAAGVNFRRARRSRIRGNPRSSSDRSARALRIRAWSHLRHGRRSTPRAWYGCASLRTRSVSVWTPYFNPTCVR